MRTRPWPLERDRRLVLACEGISTPPDDQQRPSLPAAYLEQEHILLIMWTEARHALDAGELLGQQLKRIGWGIPDPQLAAVIAQQRELAELMPRTIPSRISSRTRLAIRQH
jgi:hypothetical protein